MARRSVELIREICEDKLTITISITIRSGAIIQRKYVADLKYETVKYMCGLPYYRYEAYFDDISTIYERVAGRQITITATSPEGLFDQATRIVKEDAKRFADNTLRNDGSKSHIYWPNYRLFGDRHELELV